MSLDSAETIDYYERTARHYATLISPVPPASRAAALERLRDAIGDNRLVLEIGSGPGRDADHLESLGLRVRRTDAARAFAELQAERGKRVDALDVTADALGGPYGGVLALCVLMHVDRDAIDGVLARIAAALEPGGPLLVSVRDGHGETAGPAAMAFWTRGAFAGRLEAAGLTVRWSEHTVDSDDDAWVTFLGTRRSATAESLRTSTSAPSSIAFWRPRSVPAKSGRTAGAASNSRA